MVKRSIFFSFYLFCHPIMPKVNPKIITEEEKGIKRREQQRLASQRYRLRCATVRIVKSLSLRDCILRNKSKYNAKADECQV